MPPKVNIFLAILNDAYIAVKEQFDNEPRVEAKPMLTLRQRWANLRAWFQEQRLERNIERLRKEQRKRDLAERRVARKRNELRTKTLQGMGMVMVSGRAAPVAAKGGVQMGSAQSVAQAADSSQHQHEQQQDSHQQNGCGRRRDSEAPQASLLHQQ